jgi:hypothetical protein
MISLQELDKKLSQLRRRDPELKLFGASTHRYTLNPPLGVDEIERFEQDAGVKLPEEYRNFLTRIGNGGAGPYYGLFSLEQVRSEFDDEFPLERIGELFLPPRTAHDERFYPVQGAIPIAHVGCGSMVLIVGTGSEHGNIWTYCVDERLRPYGYEIPAYPPNSTIEERIAANDALDDRLLADRSSNWGFCKWYEDWLTRSLQKPSATIH